MKVHELMSNKPITAKLNTSFIELWRLIFEKHISGVPIVGPHNTLEGIVSEEDIIEKLYPSYEDFIFDPQSALDFEEMEKNLPDLHKLTARDLLNKDVYTTTEETPIMKAASSMMIYKVSCLPVVRNQKEKKVIVGIICKGDIFSHLFRLNLGKKEMK